MDNERILRLLTADAPGSIGETTQLSGSIIQQEGFGSYDEDRILSIVLSGVDHAISQDFPETESS